MIKSGIYPKSSVDLLQLVSKIQKDIKDSEVGAIITFLGVSKEKSTVSDKKVKSVIIEAYKDEADKIIEKICSDLKSKYSLNSISIIHLEGEFLPTEPIVTVIVAAESREQAFKAIMEAIERYKKEPPIFKKENYTDGSSQWIF
ncbi:MAG: molybdenum cofactor biosynthesis protein MoaE [Nitrososphaeria archaeon]